MLGFGKKKTPANANNVNSVITTQDTNVDKEEDKSIPNVPRFTIDDYDDTVDENYSMAFAELSLSNPLGEAGLQTVLSFLNAEKEQIDDFVAQVYSDTDNTWELGNGSTSLVTDYNLFFFQKIPLERSKNGVFKSVQTMVNFLSKNLKVGVNEIDAVEFFPSPKSTKSHRIFINDSSRLDKEFFGNKEKVLAIKEKLKAEKKQ